MTDPTDTARETTGAPTRVAREWYIDAAGRTDGPLSDADLRARAADGLLQPTDRVSSDRATWVPAASVPGLVFPPAAARTPGPGSTVVPAPRRPLVETVVSASSPTDSSLAESEISPLDAVPGYDLQGTLGTGACGIVYRAVQKKLNRVVALKTVRMAQNASADVLARFDQEAVSLARLQHPNIVAVYDCGHTDGRAYFAMELLDGEDLGDRLLRAGPLDERTAWLVARQTAAALDHASQHGVIHRDVKPANLFLVPPPTGFPLPSGVPMVKVTDFGLALTQRGPDESDPTQTAAGVILGTPVYMAPEQFRGGPVDVRADIYSLGVTVRHVLTGKIPFDGRTVLDVMAQKAAPPARLPAPFSEETADLVAAMTAPDARDRPENYAELIARIDALPCLDGAFSSAGLPIATPRPAPTTAPVPAPEPPPKRKRWAYAVAAVVLLGAAVGAAVLASAFNSSRGKPDPDAKAAATYTRGESTDLFGKSVFGWAGTPVEFTKKDVEDKPALTLSETVTRKLSGYPNFGVIVSISLHEATAVDIVLATTSGAPVTRWVVRLDPKTGAAFGKRVGTGAFESVGEAVAVQFSGDRSPYRELRYELAGGVLSVWFDSKPLGTTTDATLNAHEIGFDIKGKGGSIRIDAATEVELIEDK